MGYTFIIGNAKAVLDMEDFPAIYTTIEVDSVTSSEAPSFPNDKLSNYCNERHPSYDVWMYFCEQTGLKNIFYDSKDQNIGGHPGCFGITSADLEQVREALEKQQKKAILPPGFDGWRHEGDSNYDSLLARLIWLHWWMKWALENCETPVIKNY